jgi:N-acetylglucosaminyldiphosphoundecaprenol N-acetyl-beta-D-mannosaminyltransferase
MKNNLVNILGVKICNFTEEKAFSIIEKCVTNDFSEACTLFFVNTHTLNTSFSSSSYRQVLNDSTWVFGDGTGVRWAAKLQGIRIKANLNGTDFFPYFFQQTSNRGHRYYLLGADEETIKRAAKEAKILFPGWVLAGFHHGYILDKPTTEIVTEINSARVDLLLIGMGNPLQERFIAGHKELLEVKVIAGVGGLFDYWGGNITRAPLWVRNLGFEWVHLMLQQKKRIFRYLLGNPLFLFRIFRERFL